jgi:hypothetical protein
MDADTILQVNKETDLQYINMIQQKAATEYNINT